MNDSLKENELLIIINNLRLEKNYADKLKKLTLEGKVQEAIYSLLPYINTEIKKQERELERIDDEYSSEVEKIEKSLMENDKQLDVEFENFFSENYEGVLTKIDDDEREFVRKTEEIMKETWDKIEEIDNEFVEKSHSLRLENVRSKINNL